MNRDILVVGITFLMVASSLQSMAASDGMNQPINCATAEGDIRVLNSEKTHVAEQVIKGVTAILPAGAVLGILTGTEGKKLEIATGDYNKKIDKRIADIKSTCGL